MNAKKPVQVAIWQLADDEEAYGEKAGWFLLVSPDGEHERSIPFATEEEAIKCATAWQMQIVPLEEPTK